MNEVTKIHLGRQAFTIATDAHKTLRSYLSAIESQVKDKEVVEEIEMRMAELLVERGIEGDKVLLAKDVEYLKAQLGDPEEFSEDNEAAQSASANQAQKKLYRDTDNGMFAGVAAGLAKYLGVDVVIVRVLFIAALIAGGWGLLIYILFWLLIPDAKTPSEKLQMQGRAVTVEGLKDMVERADVKSAAIRANSMVAPVVNG